MSVKLRTAAIAVSIIGVSVFAIFLVSGLLYERVQRARDLEQFPQIGRSVDIGGRALNIYCTGADPKALFENGAPRPGYSWVLIQRELAKTTTACWYDRAGSGWSDPWPIRATVRPRLASLPRRGPRSSKISPLGHRALLRREQRGVSATVH
jgi:hypothetical protein